MYKSMYLAVLSLLTVASPALAAPFAYVSRTDTSTVEIVDLATNVMVAAIPVGPGPHGVAANVAGTAVYVLNTGDGTVSVIDASARRLTATIQLGTTDVSPSGLALSPDGTRLYIANRSAQSMMTIDTAAGALVPGVVSLGMQPGALAVHPSGDRIYVARAGGLDVVQPSTMTVSSIDLPFEPAGIAVAANGATLYAASGDGDVEAIDGATLTRSFVARVQGAQGTRATAATLSADGRTLYVAVGSGVAPISTETRQVAATIDLPAGSAAFGAFIANARPAASPSAVVTAKNTAAAMTLQAADTDGDPLSYRIVEAPAHGTLTGTLPALTFTPAPGFAGTDRFSFAASDGAIESAAAPVTVTVPLDTSVTVTSSTPASTYGQPVALSAVITSGGAPSGSVEFFDGAAPLGSAAVSNGKSSLTTSAIGAGTRSIKAVYTPDAGTFAGSTSPIVTQTVAKASGTSAITVAVLTPQYSDMETLRATFTPSVPGGPAPARVVFRVGTQVVGTAPGVPAGSVYQYTWTGQMIEPVPYGTGPRQMKPDFRVITAASDDSNVSMSGTAKSITISAEDARVSYDGPKAFSLGGSSGTVTLTVAVQDISAVPGDPASDALPGDIRNAQVSLIDRSTNMILATVSPAAGTDTTTGTATFKWNVNLGTAKSKSYTLGFVVGYYYRRNLAADNVVVTVSK